jgi:hypothetical protein
MWVLKARATPWCPGIKLTNKLLTTPFFAHGTLMLLWFFAALPIGSVKK